MPARPLTMNDLCVLSGYSRDQVRGLLNKLPMYAERRGRARIATLYSAQDLMVVALCCRLETRYSLKREAVAALAPHISKELARPRSVARHARLILEFDPPSATYVEKVGDLADGLIIALEPIFEQVDDYLLPGHSARVSMQRDLALGPVVLASGGRTTRAGKGAARIVKSATKG